MWIVQEYLFRNTCKSCFTFFNIARSGVQFAPKFLVSSSGSIFTGRNEVVAKIMFLLVSVILFTGGVSSRENPPSKEAPPGRETSLGRENHPPGRERRPPRQGDSPLARRPPWQGGPPAYGQ